MTGKERWGEDFTCETPGMCAEYALGTASGIDMSSIQHRTIPGLCKEMMPAAKAMAATFKSDGDPIKTHIGAGEGSPFDFMTKKNKAVSCKSAETIRSGSLYPNVSGQLTPGSLGRVFSDLVAQHLPPNWMDDPREAYKRLVIAAAPEMVLRHARNALQANWTVIFTRTLPRDPFRVEDKTSSSWLCRRYRSDRARTDAIDKTKIRLVMTTVKEENWTKTGVTVGYETEWGMLNLGNFKNQTNRPRHDFCFSIPTLLWLIGPQSTRPMGCPMVKDAWQRTTEPTLFE